MLLTMTLLLIRIARRLQRAVLAVAFLGVASAALYGAAGFEGNSFGLAGKALVQAVGDASHTEPYLPVHQDQTGALAVGDHGDFDDATELVSPGTTQALPVRRLHPHYLPGRVGGFVVPLKMPPEHMG